MTTHSPCGCRGSTGRSQRCGCRWSDIQKHDVKELQHCNEMCIPAPPQDRLVFFFATPAKNKKLTMATPTLIRLASWWVESKWSHQDWLDIHHPPAISKGFDFLVGVNHYGWLHGYIQHDVGCQHHLSNLKINTRCDTLPATNSILAHKNGWL